MNIQKIKEYFEKHLWLGPVLIGTALRLFEITYSSIWHDEGYTMWLIRYDFAGIVARTARDVHPPMYYFFAKVWVTFFGTSEFAIRSLSLLFSLGIIYLTFKIVKEIWDERAAFWSAMLLAFSPFMIRFAQEARMYGVVAFFTTLATYFFVKAYKDKARANWWLVGYTTAMIVAMYTQYYSFFVIVSLWVIYAVLTKEFWQFHWLKAIKEAKGVFCWKWWLANIALLVLYLPWFPVAYRQVTRVGGSYWIRPEWITARTIPNNILQFITYTHLDGIYSWNVLGKVAYWLVVLILITVGFLLYKFRDKAKVVTAIYFFGYLPMLLVFTVSKLRTPIYQDRYFPFSAVALFVIWGIAISVIKNGNIRRITGVIALLILTVGIYEMHLGPHRMHEVSNILKSNQQSGDKIYSGELYTFLDGSYYIGYGDIKFISNPVDGYGETSLFYDMQDKYVINLKDAQESGNRVWVLGKTGDKDYFSDEKWLGWTKHIYFSDNGSDGLKLVLYTR